MRGEQVNKESLWGFFVQPLAGIALERKLSSEKELMQESHQQGDGRECSKSCCRNSWRRKVKSLKGRIRSFLFLQSTFQRCFNN